MINDQRQGRVAPPFTETLRAVRADPPGGWAGALVVVGLLFVAWLLWFCLAPLPVVVESRQVRVEAEELQVIAVEAATLRALRVQVGQSVEEGELLAELEVPGLEAEVAAAEAEARWLEAKTAELQRRLGPAGEAQQALRQQAEAEARAATERYTAAQVAEADAQQEVESLQRLLGARATTTAD
ncbi:MAG TPA: biotin/lipoyl-binding protein, partial [Myxococcota bacterium]|nr:biotin/lipoyl-binding protein [Myxococcota bacterium]